MTSQVHVDTNYFKKFLTQSSHYVLGQGITLLAGFISFPIFTRVFSTAEYGVMNLISIFLWIGVAFTKAGLQESGVRYYNEFDTAHSRGPKKIYYNTIFFGGFLFIVVGGMAAWGALTFLLHKNIVPELRGLVFILVLTLIVSTLFNRLSNFLRAEQRTGLFNIFGVLDRYLVLILGIGFLFVFGVNLKNLFLGMLLAESILVLALFYLYFREKKIDFSGISFGFFKECVLFGFPLIGFELANYLIKSADRYLIQIYMGAEAVGIYSAGANLCHYLKDIIMFPVLFTITPIYMELWQKSGKQITAAFISKILKYVVYFSIPLIVGFSFVSEKFIIILASAKYAQAATVIPYLITGAVLFSLFPLSSAGLYIQKKTYLLTALIGVGVFLNIGLNILFIPHLYLLGAALATLISYLFILVTVIILSYKYLPISVELTALAKTLVGSAGMLVFLKSLDTGNDLWGFSADVVFGSLFYGTFLILFDPEIRKVFSHLMAFPAKLLRR